MDCFTYLPSSRVFVYHDGEYCQIHIRRHRNGHDISRSFGHLMHSATSRTPKLQNSRIFKIHYFTTMGSIKEALADLRLQEEPNILQTAKKHKVFGLDRRGGIGNIGYTGYRLGSYS